MAKTPVSKRVATKKTVVKKTIAKKRGRPAKAAPKAIQLAPSTTQAPQKNTFEEKFGEGTAFDLDYGKILIIVLCVYIAVQVS